MESGDTFTGSVKTLSINAKATIKAADKGSDKAPDYRVFAGSIEFGAAWKKTSNEGPSYCSVKLDDPSFPAPLPTAYRHVRGIDPVRNRGNPIRSGKFHIRMGARTARI